MSAPQVYRAISAVSRALSGEGIAKRHCNERDDYRYRSIDDVLNRLSPLLVKHKLCVLPRVLERAAVDRTGDGDLLLVSVTLRIAFDLVSIVDGSNHTIESFGEALDASDKATAKAMSSAYKHAMLQLFCVPVAQNNDADAGSHRLKRGRSHASEPVEGWEAWATGTIDIARSCVSPDALERLQDRQRPLLKAISRERPELYAQLGTAFAELRATVDSAASACPAQFKPGEGYAEPTVVEPAAGCAEPRSSQTDPSPDPGLGASRTRKSARSDRAKSAKSPQGRIATPTGQQEQATNVPTAVPEPA